MSLASGVNAAIVGKGQGCLGIAQPWTEGGSVCFHSFLHAHIPPAPLANLNLFDRRT
jgi:hypothetical protein